MALRRLAATARLACFVCFVGATPSPAEEPPASSGAKTEVAAAREGDDDLPDELPRVAPKEPAEARKTFQLRPGFRIELVASEPLIRDPVAVDFDENGRMFVVEFPEYNAQHAQEPAERRGVVKILEDTDGDGRYDRATTYVDDLSRATAVACYDGGIFVGVAPDILYCKDTDGDGRADTREVVFTGFGKEEGRAGQAVLNSFRWGFDNRFHVSTNFSGGEVRRAGADGGEPIAVRGRGFLFDPRTLDYEATSGGGQHGMALDDWGRKFVCTNSRPIQMLMYDDRYLARNPYVDAPPPAVRILAEGESQKLYRTSRIEPWRIIRTRLRVAGEVTGPIEGGGTASGYFTAATGITAYRGDAWPEEYRGDLYVGDVASNIVYRAKLEEDGVGAIARRAEPEVEFVSSTDNWFRPVQFANGPDGCLYVVDMYRELIEGGRFLPPEVLKQVNVMGGVDRGRIYRIVPDDFVQPEAVRLGEASSSELVELLDHPNGWYRDTAGRLLHQRSTSAGPRETIPHLRRLASEASLPQGRVHALWTLQSMEALRPADLQTALRDPHPRVREQAVRLSEGRASESPAVWEALVGRVDDPDLRVRYQLAFSLGTMDGVRREQALVRLLQRDGDSRWMRLAVLSSLHSGSGTVFERLARESDFREQSHGREFLLTLATQIGESGSKPDIAAALNAIEFLSRTDEPLAREVIQRLAIAQDLAGSDQLTSQGESGRLLTDLLDDAKQKAVNESNAVPERAEAVRTLALLPFEDLQPLARQFLSPRQPPPIQSAAVEILARFEAIQVVELLLDAWSGFSPDVRRQAVEVLFSRPTWIHAFLDAVENGRVQSAELAPARIQVLQSHPETEIRQRVETLFADAGLRRRQDVVDRYQEALENKGDVDRGRKVFRKTCTACHRLEGEGNEVGADLREIRRRGRDTMLLHILDPNREIDPRYLSYVLLTESGRTQAGMIAAETANSLTLRRSDGTTVTVRRSEIEQFQSTGLSFMPEGLEEEIDAQAMADLLAYLESIK